jgi:hypothetical protein
VPEWRKPAGTVMVDARTALQATSSYRVVGMLDDDLDVSLTVTPQGSRGALTSHGVSWQEVSIGPTIWFRGRSLWRATTSAATAQRLGDRWVRVTDEHAGFGWAGPVRNLPSTIPLNFFTAKGALRNLGRRTVDGRPVVRIANGADRHDVLTSGPPYPVDWLETDEPGPDGQPCGVALSAFNAPVRLVRPRTDLVFRG